MSGAGAATGAGPAAVFLAARAGGRTALLEHEVYAVLAAAGFDIPRHVFWDGTPGLVPTEIEDFLEGLRGDDVVLKIVSPDLAHKSDVGGFSFSKKSPASVIAAARTMWEDVSRRAPAAQRLGILVVEKLVPASGAAGAEALVSFKQDLAFGPVLLFGLGGVLTEWYGSLSGGASTAILRPGEVKQGLEAAVEKSPALKIFFERSRAHAQAPLVLDEVAARLELLSRNLSPYSPENSLGNPTLEELEVNPVVLTADGRWVAADGKARFSNRRFATSARPLAKIENLLAPRSAVVFGASAREVNPGRIILRNLKVSETIAYGSLRAVHPRADTIDGVPCVKNVSELAATADLAVVAIPAAGARDAIRELCAGDLARAIILIPGGFSETGNTGLEDDILAALAESRRLPSGGPVLVGGNCLGVVSKHAYNTFFLPQYKLPFHDAPGDRLVAVSQSGAYLVSLTSNLDGIVFPRASISYGNQIDLTAADFLEYFERDPSVRVLAFYVEGFAPLDGARFAAIARRITAAGRHVLVYKAGRTALGAEAARSHTAALAGDWETARALLEGAGAVVAVTLDMFEDYVKIFTMLADRPVPGRRLAVLSNAGFECGAVLDRLYRLTPAVLAPGTRARLAACLPSIAHADNPVDATPMAATAEFVAAAEALLRDPGVDALLISPIPVTPALDDLAPDLSGAHAENIFSRGSLPQELLRLFRETAKPLVVNVDSGRLYDDFVSVLQRGGIPVYRKIDRASRALSALCS
ncbi:MAG TPA: acetate--CoA ligase family protein [Thermoanaerobaculia bacterium]|nr:acetate--CoA ligase family protein [Thermoanaerobaculia bacterium]